MRVGRSDPSLCQCCWCSFRECYCPMSRRECVLQLSHQLIGWREYTAGQAMPGQPTMATMLSAPTGKARLSQRVINGERQDEQREEGADQGQRQTGSCHGRDGAIDRLLLHLGREGAALCVGGGSMIRTGRRLFRAFNVFESTPLGKAKNELHYSLIHIHCPCHPRPPQTKSPP